MPAAISMTLELHSPQLSSSEATVSAVDMRELYTSAVTK